MLYHESDLGDKRPMIKAASKIRQSTTCLSVSRHAESLVGLINSMLEQKGYLANLPQWSD